jgi:hypothetical protein
MDSHVKQTDKIKRKRKGDGSSYKSLISERYRDVAFTGEWSENWTALYSLCLKNSCQLTFNQEKYICRISL